MPKPIGGTDGLTTTTSAAAGDLLPIWVAASGVTRAITKIAFMGGALTGGGTIATGGFTLTVPATGTAALPTIRNQFTVGQGMAVTKTGVAHNTATAVAELELGGSGGLNGGAIVAIECGGSAFVSGGIYALTCAFSAVNVTELTKSMFGNTVLTLAVAINTTTRKISFTVTQNNSGSAAATIRLAVLPILLTADGALTLTAL